MTKHKAVAMLLFSLAAMLLAACGGSDSSLKSDSIDEVPTYGQTGTFTGRALSTINMTTGKMDIHGMAVELDSGELIEAYLEKGIVDVLVKGIRVSVVPIQSAEYEWSVKEILPDGVPTPDVVKTAEAASPPCE